MMKTLAWMALVAVAVLFSILNSDETRAQGKSKDCKKFVVVARGEGISKSFCLLSCRAFWRKKVLAEVGGAYQTFTDGAEQKWSFFQTGEVQEGFRITRCECSARPCG